MATADYIKQNEIITAAKVVNAFNEKENVANRKTTLTNSTTDYPTTSLLTAELNKKEDVANKKETITDTNDTDYPTSKAVYNALSDKSDSSHNHDSTYLKLSGGTMTGTIYVPSKATAVGNNPTLLATEAQVYNALSGIETLPPITPPSNETSIRKFTANGTYTFDGTIVGENDRGWYKVVVKGAGGGGGRAILSSVIKGTGGDGGSATQTFLVMAGGTCNIYVGKKGSTSGVISGDTGGSGGAGGSGYTNGSNGSKGSNGDGYLIGPSHGGGGGGGASAFIFDNMNIKIIAGGGGGGGGGYEIMSTGAGGNGGAGGSGNASLGGSGGAGNTSQGNPGGDGKNNINTSTGGGCAGEKASEGGDYSNLIYYPAEDGYVELYRLS